MGQWRPDGAGESGAGRRDAWLETDARPGRRIVFGDRRDRVSYARDIGANGTARSDHPARDQWRRDSAEEPQTESNLCGYFEQAGAGAGRRRDEPGIGDFCVYGGGDFSFDRKSARRAVPEVHGIRTECGERGHLCRTVCALSQTLFLAGTEERAGHGDRRRTAGVAANRGECVGPTMMLTALREEVLVANLELARRGLAADTFGNASGVSRDKELIVIKPSGVAYAKLRAKDLVVTDMDGKVVEGSLRPSSDLATHAILYRKFTKIGGIAHTHSKSATIWAQAGRE